MPAALFADLRHSIRQLVSTPSFTVPAVTGLGLAIAATTAVFSIVNATMLHSLGFTGKDRIVAIWSTDAKRGQKHVEACYGDLVDWRKQTDIFDGVALASSVNLDFPIHGDSAPQQVDGSTVSGDFFRLLGAKAAIGRLLTGDDDQPNAPMRVVISHRLWQSRFGADPGIAGRQIRGGDGTATIVGVASKEFDFPRDVDIWSPLRASWPTVEQQPRFRVFRAAGRLKPGVTVERAQTHLNVLAAQIAKTLPPGTETFNVTVTPMLDEIYGPARRAIWVLMSAVFLVLLIACANTANLLLARATVRGRELAVRSVLGANRTRLVRLLLSEAFVLAVAACALGLALAWVFIRGLAILAPPEVPRMEAVAMNLPVFLFGILLALCTVLLFGLGPAIIACNRDPNGALKESGRGSSSTPAQGRLRTALVVAEVALSLVLLVGAGLLLRSFRSLSAIDPGFSPERVLTFRVTTGIPVQEQRRALYGAILERIRALPGVESAGAVLLRPLSGLVGWDGVYMIEGQSPEEQRNNPGINYQAISPGYFRTMGIGMRGGRDFTGADTEKATGVVILNESTARRHWPHQSAVGKRLRLGVNTSVPMLTVVGVVDDVRYREWEAVRPDFYVPYTQRAQHRTDFVVKTADSPGAMANAVRNAVFAVDKNQPVSQIATMERLVDRALSRSRFIATVLLALAAAALLLATMGIYGVLAYNVAQRRYEIGIRMAVGATPARILRQLVSGGLRMAATGAAAGVALALLASRLITSLLYGVTSFDVLAYSGALLATLALAAIACAVPAWRAAQTDPGVVLNAE